MTSLAEAFPQERARVRKLLGTYREIGPVGAFGAAMIEHTLQRADRAAASGDVIAMLQSYEELKGCQ